MTIINTLHSILDSAGKINEKLPEEWRQRLPGFLGLSLADEQLFNSVLGQLDSKDQVIIMAFLAKCKDYERNRFINIVAGMEVVEEGKINEKKESFDDSGKKVIETKQGSKGKKDTRKDFLESFAKVISEEFKGDFDKAHEFCVAGRMMITDPIHQKALRGFSESVGWFKKIILNPLKAVSVEDLKNNFLTNFVAKTAKKVADGEKNNRQDLTTTVAGWRKRAEAWRKK
ncbi:MAG TPA: hypothetical protein DCS08_04360 [Candidatus Moranbacteria bacterium]|nr:hypothetical protein [Candidatus Moranbacteria bacterium]HBY11424.1 hypothetical protein [Candidatus Moranbacteria bacterium]